LNFSKMGNCVSNSNDDFHKEILNVHNAYRSEHGCPPLKLDRKLSRFAQSWASRLAEQRAMEHRPNNEYGENLYMKGGQPPPVVDGRMPVAAWYGEIRHYTFGVGGFSPQTGHFTQVVWKETTKLGVGVAKNK
jgi:glioma pathogenesis-related protein 2